MKSILYALLLSVSLFGCTQNNDGKIMIPRPLAIADNFNQFPKDKNNVLSIFQQGDTKVNKRADRIESETYRIKYADTVVKIQMNAEDKKSVIEQFSFAEFLNTQKSSMLVQPADSSGLVAPFYIITVNNDKLEVVNLYRAASGAEDSKYAKGVTPVGRSGYVINNDFFVASVSAKIYPIKRLKEEERIHGVYLLNSPDKKTLVFLMAGSLYEVYYPTGETYTQPLPASAPADAVAMMNWIQNNYSWQRNETQISFLKKNIDDNRIIDIKDFK